MLKLLRHIFPNLSCLFSTFHLEYPSVLVRLKLLTIKLLLFINVLDNDECVLGTALCDQVCINTHGSYRCACNSGYQLLSDPHKCYGIFSIHVID